MESDLLASRKVTEPSEVVLQGNEGVSHSSRVPKETGLMRGAHRSPSRTGKSTLAAEVESRDSEFPTVGASNK